MPRLKEIARRPGVQQAIGWSFARYLDFVRLTNRFTIEPADAYDRLGPAQPFIGAMWHGQHFMAPYLRRPRTGRRASSRARATAS